MYIYTHIHMIHRPAKEERGSAATGPPSSLYVIPSGIYLFVILARVSVHRTRGLFWMFVGLFWVTTGLCWGCESECTALCLRSRTLSILWRARRNARTNAHTHTHTQKHTHKRTFRNTCTHAHVSIFVFTQKTSSQTLSLSRVRALSHEQSVILSYFPLKLSFSLFFSSQNQHIEKSPVYIQLHMWKSPIYMYMKSKKNLICTYMQTLNSPA